ncbi:hypothetical protein HHK36_023064 [Tetracentron sinense]|uniref:DYW domain-containing protein n=1 Tax=Tetracentron sinense TaxID=13715 RepID=A0A834YT24_TETSI|nr:hypothetical protein HHK36_023064 [Tetracentron sinense]
MNTMTTTEPSYHLIPNELSAQDNPTTKLSQKTISNLLGTKCSTSLQHLKQIHAQVIRNGLSEDNYIAGSLVKCYANPHFSSLGCALKVFDQVPRPHAFLWNSLIKGCLENNDPQKAISFYHKMMVADSRPNKFTYPTLFKACTVARVTEEGVQVHAHVVKHGLGGDEHIRSAGIQMYACCGRLIEAHRMLDESRESDAVCWNAMIDGYLKCEDLEAAKGLFDRMPVRNAGSWNAMITGYARSGMVEIACKLFNEMPQRDDVSWSAMIDGYIKEGYYKEALEVFHDMQRERVKPRKFILSSVLAVCANVGALDQGRWIHNYIQRNSIPLDAILGTSLVDMYAKCGSLDLAWDVFEKMKWKEVFSWNAMIGGLAMHGCVEDVIDLFLKMQREKCRPDGITFVGVLNACAHAGLVDEGLKYFNSMKRVYGVEPAVEHYGCVVDLLGRAGLLAKANDLIWSMPMKPSAAVWGALLGACRIHGNVELGEKVGKVLLELEPLNSGRYALLSNIYAKAGRWEDVAQVRTLMKKRGIKTTPGSSLIDLDGVLHEFVMGDGSHPQMKEIHFMLKEIIQRLQLEGYIANTTQVLFDIDEEEKETALSHHSEKLAIAFGFLNTTQGTTIRIVKNLRVCEDCHSATKLISLVYNREIIVRDRVRFIVPEASPFTTVLKYSIVEVKAILLQFAIFTLAYYNTGRRLEAFFQKFATAIHISKILISPKSHELGIDQGDAFVSSPHSLLRRSHNLLLDGLFPSNPSSSVKRVSSLTTRALLSTDKESVLKDFHEQKALKIISGLLNFDRENVASVVTAADKVGFIFVICYRGEKASQQKNGLKCAYNKSVRISAFTADSHEVLSCSRHKLKSIP